MCNRSPKKLLLWLCLGICLGAAGVDAQYRIDQWTADDGLPQNSVYGIVQTADGYIWVATVDGLARFDGVQFTIFNKSNSAGIVNNRFVSLFEDAHRNLWAGTEESGIVRFSGQRFESYGIEAGVPRGVYWIEADHEGDGVLFSGDNRWIRFRDGKFSPFSDRANSPTVPAERSLNRKVLCRTNSENKHFECLVNARWLSFTVADGSSPEHIVSGDLYLSAAQEPDGTIWLVTVDGRLARAENGRVTQVYDERDGLPKSPMSFIVGARLGLIAKDADESVWLIELPSMQRQLLSNKAVGPLPRDRSEVLSSYADDEGGIWFGTKRGGLLRARKQITTAYSEVNGISDKNVYPIYQDHNRTIWIGTMNGLVKYENGSFTPIRSTKGFAVNAIAEDRLGRLLISDPSSLYVLEKNEFVPFERAAIPAMVAINAIYTDREKALWVGGGAGLWRFKDGHLTTFSTDDGLAGRDVKAIIEARGGGVWIATYDGLTRFNNGHLTSWHESDGLPSRTVRSLYEDADGALWIGSYDGGLARFKDGKFTRYDTKVGLPNDGAFQILEDDRRRFWISSNRGIYSVSRDELNDLADGKISRVNSTAYGKSDGMLNIECNGGRWPAGVRASDGRLWFPTQDGVAVIEPQNIKSNSRPPPVVIETVTVDNEPLQVPAQSGGPSLADSDFAGNPPTDPPAGTDVTISPDQQNFEIRYTALSFINSENLRFRYKLEGLDEAWVEAGTRRLAYFSHVPPGAYTFRVIAANSDNIWNERGAALKILVLSPFYRTWWFLILTFLVIAGVMLSLFKRRVAQLNLKHAAGLAFSRRLIDSQEQERKRFAAEMHDGLGQSLVIIKNRASLSLKQTDQREAMLDHLRNISETASHAINEVKEIAFSLRPHLLDRLGLTKTLESMLVKVFGASGIEFETDIHPIDDVLDKDSEILVYRIVQECANNIVKHSHASKAVLKVEHIDGRLTIRISDNGCGFNPSVTGDDLSRRSFGLVGISERTRLLRGRLSIESQVGKGTTISIIIDPGGQFYE